MTKAQIILYRVEWANARKAAARHGLKLTDEDRHAIHLRDLGVDISSTKLTNDQFDKILASFRAISHPTALDPQLSAMQQPDTRLLHRLRGQLKCLRLFIHSPGAYLERILCDRFKLSLDHARAVEKHLLEHAPLDRIILVSVNLEQLRNTLDRCLGNHRRSFNIALERGETPDLPFHSPLRSFCNSGAKSLTEHNMCFAAGVDCFRNSEGRACAHCRDSAPSSTGSADAINLNARYESLQDTQN